MELCVSIWHYVVSEDVCLSINLTMVKNLCTVADNSLSLRSKIKYHAKFHNLPTLNKGLLCVSAPRLGNIDEKRPLSLKLTFFGTVHRITAICLSQSQSFTLPTMR